MPRAAVLAQTVELRLMTIGTVAGEPFLWSWANDAIPSAAKVGIARVRSSRAWPSSDSLCVSLAASGATARLARSLHRAPQMDSRFTGTDLAADLNGVAAVSDQIRRLGRQAFLMQLHAINAIVASSSHGVRVPGFAVVSQQMRELSTELGGCLTQLRSATLRWLSAVSHQVGRARSIETIEAASRMSPTARTVAGSVLEQLRADREADATPQLARRAFIIVLDEARRLASTGCVLARTAKLEATYGDRIAGTLAESAGSFTELADSVDEAVRVIARRLTAAGRRMA